MILVISSTNRPDSYTRKIADNYIAHLKTANADCELLYLEDLPKDFFSPEVYAKKEGGVRKLIDEKLIPADKYVFIVPEYNGSIPGVLKLLIDTVEVNPCFYGKKAGIIGVSAGQAGNLRGIDHLMAVLNHLKMQIMPNQPKLSSIGNAFDEEGVLLGKYADQIKDHALQISSF